jgi:REP element-mobilizing transposase RayT
MMPRQGFQQRKWLRLGDYDYASPGAYFVTACTNDRACLFDEVWEGEMVLNRAGRAVESVWRALAGRFASVALDAFVVMPNHIHGVLVILDPAGTRDGWFAATGPASAEDHDGDREAGAASSAPTNDLTSVRTAPPDPVEATNWDAPWAPLDPVVAADNAASPAVPLVGALLAAPASRPAAPTLASGQASVQPPRPTLGQIIRVLKSASALEVNRHLGRTGRPVWQRGYFERVIQDERELDVVRRYIAENPAKWELDRENPLVGSTGGVKGPRPLG